MSWAQSRKPVMIVLICIIILSVALQADIRAVSNEVSQTPISKQAILGMETIREFAGGKLCKVELADHSCKDLILYNNGKIEVYNPVKHERYFKPEKLSGKLQNKLESAGADEIIPVVIWMTDIDTAKVDNTIKAKLQLKAGRKVDQVQNKLYKLEKRLRLKEAYLLKNQAFLKAYTGTTKTGGSFISSYAPLVIANLTKQQIRKAVKDQTVISIDYFNNKAKVNEIAYSGPNINVNYTKEVLNLQGKGVSVGVLESGYPDKSNAELADRNIIFDLPDSVAQTRLSSHATMVSSIIVGKKNGIVPEATLYVAAALTQLDDYRKIEWLIEQGVSVINYSAGYSETRGEYTDMAKWIDHLGNQHHVHFVKSAGNQKNSNYLISDPGMAYNAIIVGSVFDHDSPSEPDWTDDTLSDFSCYGENSGGYKPDLAAPGEGINTAGYTNYSGTSFAAPHVTGVLAQLINYRSNLTNNTALLKAICAAGTTHRTASDYGNYGLSQYYSNQEGAGVIDAKGAYQIVANSTYADLELAAHQFPYELSFSVAALNRPVRVSLAWLKQNTITEASHPEAAVTEVGLSDLDLVVYGPTGNFVANSMSAANNVELVEFIPNMTGTYRIRVLGYAVQNSSEKISLAWYQQP